MKRFRKRSITFLLVAIIAVVVILQTTRLDFFQDIDNEIAQQQLKGSAALIELHKLRTGTYPEKLSDLEFISSWDRFNLKRVQYTVSVKRNEYFITIEKGYFGDLNFIFPHQFWKGTGFDDFLLTRAKNREFGVSLFKAIESSESAIFFNLESDMREETPGDKFYGYTIIKKSDVSGDKLQKIKNRIKEYLTADPRLEVACFNPRHGLRFTINKVQYDFVFCLECSKMRVVDLLNNDHWYNFAGNKNSFDFL